MPAGRLLLLAVGLVVLLSSWCLMAWHAISFVSQCRAVYSWSDCLTWAFLKG